MRIVNRHLLDEWVLNHGPDGIAKLALKSGISSSMISKVRVGRVPVRPNTRRDLARAINAAESDLFPPVSADENETPAAKKQRRG